MNERGSHEMDVVNLGVLVDVKEISQWSLLAITIPLTMQCNKK